MPLYQLVCIAKHYSEYRPLRTLLSESASLVHQAGGNVRRLDSLGRRVLPKRMRREGVVHEQGDYWTMDFDANPVALQQLEGKLQADPRVLRSTILRKGVTLPQITQTDPAFTLGSTMKPVSDHDLKSYSKMLSERFHMANTGGESSEPPSLENALRKSPGLRSRAEREAVETSESARTAGVPP